MGSSIVEGIFTGVAAGIISGLYAGFITYKASMFYQIKNEIRFACEKIQSLLFLGGSPDLADSQYAHDLTEKMIYYETTLRYAGHYKASSTVANILNEFGIACSCAKRQSNNDDSIQLKQNIIKKYTSLGPSYASILIPWYPNIRITLYKHGIFSFPDNS